MRKVGVAALILALSTVGCETAGGETSRQTTLTVLAASSLSKVFPRVASAFGRQQPGVSVRFSFAGTDQLAAQIQQGARADVFAGASTKYGDQLTSERLIDKPRPFCTNSLVLVVPPSNPAGVRSARDLAIRGVKLVIGASSVPIGAYTRTVLRSLDAAYGSGFSAQALANVVSNESDVEGVVTKVLQGEADAGFIYETDWRADATRLRMIALDPNANAVATYPIGIVRSSRAQAAAGGFVAFVLGPAAQSILREAGFGPPPVA